MECLKWERSFEITKEEGDSWEFKFLIKYPDGSIVWEDRYNRELPLPKILKHSTVIKEYCGADFNQGNPRFSGVAIPVFSLRSTESHGIGDFSDLRKMADWASLTGMSMIQLLPINDTTAHLTWRVPNNITLVLYLA